MDSERVKILTDENFTDTIAQGVTLVTFGAPTCGVCRQLGFALERVAEQIGDRALVAHLDIDAEEETATRLDIRIIPLTYIYRDGVLVNSITGMKKDEEYLSALEAALGEPV